MPITLPALARFFVVDLYEGFTRLPFPVMVLAIAFAVTFVLIGFPRRWANWR